MIGVALSLFGFVIILEPVYLIFKEFGTLNITEYELLDFLRGLPLQKRATIHYNFYAGILFIITGFFI